MAGFESALLTFIKHLLAVAGYPGIFVLMGIEGVGIPIPSEVTMPFSGFLTTRAGGNHFTLWAVIVVGTIGEVAGSAVGYGIGLHAGRRLLYRYGKYILISGEELERAENWFARYGDWVVLVSRLLPAIRGPISLPAGAVRMPFWRFVAYCTFGSAVWCTVLAVLGHVLGQHWASVSNDIRRYNVVIVVLVVALIAFGIYTRVAGARRRASASPAD